MRISKHDINRVLDATHIEDIIGEDCTLTNKGKYLTCCCPFHNERNPSFAVTPSMNIYKCFSCGESGGPITYLEKARGMSFVNAIKYLADKAKIKLNIDESPQTAEELEEERKREAALSINRDAVKFFADQLHADNENAKAAMKYLCNRWGKEFVEMANLGYAPGRGAFMAWAKKKGYSTELLLEIGLLNEKNGRVFDYFFDRVMMPIYSRSNQVLGFIGRVMGDEQPKYMNSKESFIFKKSDIIFGLNVAATQIAKEGLVYMVEGAPDVYRLQMIGAPNAIAPLGLSWSSSQLEQLQRYNATVCLIPDIDKPKDGDFGPGIIGCMKNGKAAIEAGLKVLVKEIAPQSKEEKADADSFITSKNVLDSIDKQDFIVWYTQKKLYGKYTSVERGEVLKDVSQLLAHVRDKDYVKMMIKRLAPAFNITVSIFQNAVNVAVKGNAETKQVNGTQMMDRELYSRYGFFEYNNSYYSLNKDGIETRWSNFVLKPLFHIKDQLSPKRLYKITNVSKHSEIIELKQEDLVSIQRFKLRVEGLGNYIWEAKEEQLTKLKGFLYEKTETASEITQLGWQKDGFFAFGNGIVYNGQWMKADDYGIVRLKEQGNYYLPAASSIYKKERMLFQFERRFVHSAINEVSFRAYTDKLIQVFGDNAKVGICFFLATLFKDIITIRTKNFPILNLFGPKGSGKSELGHSLMSFFIINNEPPNLSTATDAALADAVAQCSDALVHVDEYKNTIELNRREFIKGLYDGVGRTRMNMDRDKKRETTAVDCGVILSGQEMPTIDIAIFHRMVYLPFDTVEFSSDAKRRFDELKKMRDMGCSHLVIELLKYRKRVEADFSANYNSALADLQASLDGRSIEDRIFRNWVTMLAIFRTLSGVIDVSFDYKEMLSICVNGIDRQNSICKSTNELASFWQVVDFLHQNGDIFIDADYRIKYESSFKGKGASEKIIFKQPKPVLYLRAKRVMMLYKKNGRMVGDATLPIESLRHYLEISKEYLGIKNAVRFKNISNDVESHVSSINKDGTASVKATSQTDWALAFDYRMLVENFGINLEIETVPDDEPDPIDSDDNDFSVPY